MKFKMNQIKKKDNSPSIYDKDDEDNSPSIYDKDNSPSNIKIPT